MALDQNDEKKVRQIVREEVKAEIKLEIKRSKLLSENSPIIKKLKKDTTRTLVMLEDLMGTVQAIAENMDFVTKCNKRMESLEGRVDVLEGDVRMLKSAK
jgi:hypothetical protein